MFYLKLYASSTVIVFDDVFSSSVFSLLAVLGTSGFAVVLALLNQSGNSKYNRSSLCRGFDVVAVVLSPESSVWLVSRANRECDCDVSAIDVSTIWMALAFAWLFSSTSDITTTPTNKPKFSTKIIIEIFVIRYFSFLTFDHLCTDFTTHRN